MLFHLTTLWTNLLHLINASSMHSTSLTKKQPTSYETYGKPRMPSIGRTGMPSRKSKLHSDAKSKSRFAPSKNKKNVKSNRKRKRPRRKNRRSTAQSSLLLLMFRLPLPFLSHLHLLCFTSYEKESTFPSIFSPTKGWQTHSPPPTCLMKKHLPLSQVIKDHTLLSPSQLPEPSSPSLRTRTYHGCRSTSPHTASSKPSGKQIGPRST